MRPPRFAVAFVQRGVVGVEEHQLGAIAHRRNPQKVIGQLGEIVTRALTDA